MPRRRQLTPKSPDPTEHEIQCAFVKWCRLNVTRFPELAIAFAVPNGGKRHIGTARKLQAEGVMPGIPDFIIPVPKGRFTGCAIEFKTRTGKTNDAQKDKISLLISYGWRVEVCRDWESATKIVEDYLIL